jgi:hypothetical protein
MYSLPPQSEHEAKRQLRELEKWDIAYYQDEKFMDKSPYRNMDWHSDRDWDEFGLKSSWSTENGSEHVGTRSAKT